ncbi:MAG: DUF4446 family protein, partial [Dehalococcoidales bacterium]|nr:DUF4446 family protein [Dehalococcoidales bacterium]
MAAIFEAYGPALWLILLVLVVVTLVWLVSLQSRLGKMSRQYRTLTRNVDSGNLEELLENHLNHLYQTSMKVDDVTAFCQELEQSLRRAIQQVGVVRFNPFNDTGGDQSFAIALLDGAGDGIVLSSLYSRSGNRIYAKVVEGGQSKYPLTDEEQHAIAQAMACLSTR